ncbi:hypothetical protein BH10BAC1_BH10BAC1_06900 [soil metagenome]
MIKKFQTNYEASFVDLAYIKSIQYVEAKVNV